MRVCYNAKMRNNVIRVTVNQGFSNVCACVRERDRLIKEIHLSE